MALRPLLHALSRQRVSFMLQDSGSLRSFLALGSTVLIRSGLLTKGDFLHILIFKHYPETELETARGVHPTEQVIVCAPTDAGDLRLDNARNQWGSVFIIIV